MDIDETNCRILNLLQENCRMSYSEIARRLDISVDTAKKRVEKLIASKVAAPQMQIKPRLLGYPYIVDIKVRLNPCEDARIEEFATYLRDHYRVAELFSVTGNWDFTIVIIAKDYDDFYLLRDEIKERFSDIISDWTESLTTTAYKFEYYDVLKMKRLDWASSKRRE